MLSLHCRKRFGGLIVSRCALVRGYHSYPDPNEVPVIKFNKSNFVKQIEKSEEPWQQELTEMKKKFNIDACFPGIKESSNDIKKQPAPTPEMTKLENGLTVVSIKTDDMSMSSFSFLINSGSAAEFQSADSDNMGGITSILECMAFGATAGSENSVMEDGEVETVSRQLNRIGAIDQVTTSRENMCYFVDVIRDSAERGLELLANAVLKPSITTDNVKLAVEDLAFRSNYMSADILSRDALSIAAYKDSPLGNYHFPTNMLQMELHTPEKIEQFRKSVLYGGNCILAGAGIDHDELVTHAKKYFDEKSLPATSLDVQSKKTSTYSGGIYVEKRELQEPFVKLAIGYETGGYKSENLYTMCVLDKLLGGGSSFSAGGPGKGMYTRLYLDVLNKNHWIESAQSFVVPHENCGLLGIDASCDGANIQYLFQVIMMQFTRLATEDVTDIELSRAKNMLRSQLMMQLESRLVVCEDIARQYATFGKRELPEFTCENIDKVSASDIRKLVANMIQQPPSIACIGNDISQLPPYNVLHEFCARKSKEALAQARTL